MTGETADGAGLVRGAYEAYARGDLAAMLDAIDPGLEWTYLDPSVPDPEPAVCHGRRELRIALARRAEHGLSTTIDEIRANGDRVMLVLRTPGVDAQRERQTGDLNFTVVTVRDGRIVALRECRDREEAMAVAGLG